MHITGSKIWIHVFFCINVYDTWIKRVFNSDDAIGGAGSGGYDGGDVNTACVVPSWCIPK